MADAGKGGFAALKLRVEVNGQLCTLNLQKNGAETAYSLGGVLDSNGSADVEQISPGVFSVIIKNRSVLVHVLPRADGNEVWVGLNRYLVAVADPRDKAATSAQSGAKGPAELRAQMPGKIVKLLVKEGDTVHGGQGLIVVEAMKMQNEVKSPKDGTVAKIHAAEGTTVAAGELLIVVL